MYTCECICMWVCVYVNVHVYVSVYVNVSVLSMYMWVCVCRWVCIEVCAYECVCIWACVCECVYVSICMYACEYVSLYVTVCIWMYMYVSVFVRVYVTVSLFEDGTHGITLQSKCSATGIHTQTVNAFFFKSWDTGSWNCPSWPWHTPVSPDKLWCVVLLPWLQNDCITGLSVPVSAEKQMLFILKANPGPGEIVSG